MLRRTLIIAAAATALTPWWGVEAQAAEETLNAPQIKTLLSGNTIEGKWDGTSYRSYYDPDGMTVYQADGGPQIKGKWRVDPNTDQYESWWEHTGWVNYTVLRTSTGYAWQQDGGTQPFAVVQGRKIDF